MSLLRKSQRRLCRYFDGSSRKEIVMDQGHTCTAPVVRWIAPEYQEYWANPDLIEQQVNRLIHELWWRLPDVVRTVIACGLERVMLGASEEDMFLPSFEEREIRIYLTEDVISRAWQAEVSGALAWGFGMAFLEALCVQVPGEGSWTRPIIDDARARQPSQRSDESPSLTAMMRLQENKANANLSYTAEALAVAWGFEEEMAAFLSAPEIRRLSDRVEGCTPEVIENMCMWACAFMPRRTRVQS
jgi:hypothetical protein